MPFYDDFEEIERAELYRLFASLFMQEPSEEVLMQIKEMFQMQFTDTSLEIAIDFNQIVGLKKNLLPYESLHNYPIGDSPRLWGRAAEEVQSFYISLGVMINEETNLIPDHVSAELLFMSYLIENGLIEHQERFLDEHLLKWIPEYCDEIERHASTTFYKEVAKLLKEFILSEKEEPG